MKKRVDFKNISTFEGPEQSYGFLLWRISTTWRTTIEHTLKPHELTHPQFVVIAAAAWLTKEGNDATQIMISSMTRLDPNTISQILRGLENRKLIRRTVSADPRAKNVTLTDQGSRVLSHALPAVEQADADYFAPLNHDELQQLVSIFQKLADAPSK